MIAFLTLLIAMFAPLHGEHEARAAAHIPAIVKYDGSADRIDKGQVCYEGKATKPFKFHGHTVKPHQWVNYCTDGYVRLENYSLDIGPSPRGTVQPVAVVKPAPKPAVKHHAAPKPKPVVKPTTPKTPALNEDDYGWNCFTMGNHDCGTLPLVNGEGPCVIDTDGYTMCPDGTYYQGDPWRYGYSVEQSNNNQGGN